MSGTRDSRDPFPQACARCGALLGSGSTMSKFNTEWICLPCKDDPGYAAADAAEVAACNRGEFNFPGVGLSAADLEFLAKRREKRR